MRLSEVQLSEVRLSEVRLSKVWLSGMQLSEMQQILAKSEKLVTAPMLVTTLNTDW